jgi:hypothetical protein
MRIIIITCLSLLIYGCCDQIKRINADNEKDIRIDWINRGDSSYLSSEYNATEMLQKEVLFINGQKVFNKIYHINGNLHGYGVYHNGQTIGFNSYYINGQKSVEKHYDLNGNLHGSYIMYDERGKIEVIGFYKNGIQDSIWTQYDSLGNVTLIRDKRKE